MNFFRQIKDRNIAYRRKFVVFGTSLSFLLIFSLWIPVRLAQWRTGSGLEVAEATVEPSPAVAGEQTQNLPFLKENVPSVSSSFSAPAPAPTPENTATPVVAPLPEETTATEEKPKEKTEYPTL